MDFVYIQPDAEPLESFFELNDTLYAKAQVPPTEEVYLWLGVSLSQHDVVKSRKCRSKKMMGTKERKGGEGRVGKREIREEHETDQRR